VNEIRDGMTVEELAVVWDPVMRPLVQSAGLTGPAADEALQDIFVENFLVRDLLADHDPTRMPLNAFLRGYVRKQLRGYRARSLFNTAQLTMDEPDAIEPAEDDPGLLYSIDMCRVRAFISWLDRSDPDMAALMRELYREVCERERVNPNRIAKRLGWSPERVARDLRQLREAADNWRLRG